MCMTDTGSVALWQLRLQPVELNQQFSLQTRAVLNVLGVQGLRRY